MFNDPIVEEVHRISDELCRPFNYDVHAIFEDILSREKLNADRLVVSPRVSRKDTPAAKDEN